MNLPVQDPLFVFFKVNGFLGLELRRSHSFWLLLPLVDTPYLVLRLWGKCHRDSVILYLSTPNGQRIGI